jgi:hypothetical protein
MHGGAAGTRQDPLLVDEQRPEQPILPVGDRAPRHVGNPVSNHDECNSRLTAAPGRKGAPFPLPHRSR